MRRRYFECVPRNPNDYSASSRVTMQDSPAGHSGVTANQLFHVRMGADILWLNRILKLGRPDTECKMLSICKIQLHSKVCAQYLARVIALPSVLVFRLRVRTNFFQSLKARLHRSPRLINTVESTKVNRVNSSFQRKWSTGLTGEQVGDGQLSFNVVDSLWVTHCRLPVCFLFLYAWYYFW